MVLFCTVTVSHVGENSKSGSVYWFSTMAVLCCRQAVRDYMKSGGQFTQVKGTPSDGAVRSKVSVVETVKTGEWGKKCNQVKTLLQSLELIVTLFFVIHIMSQLQASNEGKFCV